MFGVFEEGAILMDTKRNECDDRKPKILLSDDDPSTICLLKTLFEKNGFCVLRRGWNWVGDIE